jgi:hypothetical protein
LPSSPWHPASVIAASRTPATVSSLKVAIQCRLLIALPRFPLIVVNIRGFYPPDLVSEVAALTEGEA